MLPKSLKTEDFIYSLPPEPNTQEFLIKFDTYLSLFAEKIGVSMDSIFYNRALVIDIHTRLDQRSDYYHYFHSDSEEITFMSQTKEMALLCYWITKYKPLYQDKKTMETYYQKNFCTINEMFALSLIKDYVLGLHGDKPDVDKEMNFFNPENCYVMIYNFMHRDMSKESFILYVTSLLGALEV